MQIEELQRAIDVETRQAKGSLGRLWYVTIDPGNNGTIRVKVAGGTTAELLDHIWQGRLSGNRKMKPSTSTLFRSTLDLLDGITAIEPAPGRCVLHSEKWTRYVVWVYCCKQQVEVVAVSERQMKELLYRNRNRALPYAPVDDGVSWDNFRPQIVSEQPAVEGRKSVRLLPPPKVEPIRFSGIFCPACDMLHEPTAQKCRDCGAPLREDARSSYRVPTRHPIEPEPILIAL